MSNDSTTKTNEQTILANNSLADELTKQQNLPNQIATDTDLKSENSADLQKAPAAKAYDAITGMNNISKIAGVGKTPSHLLGSKIVDELMLSYA